MWWGLVWHHTSSAAYSVQSWFICSEDLFELLDKLAKCWSVYSAPLPTLQHYIIAEMKILYVLHHYDVITLALVFQSYICTGQDGGRGILYPSSKSLSIVSADLPG